MALFGNAASSDSKYLVKFRAGKCTKDDKNMVYPDKRKGWVYVHQAEDSLMHFCWKERKPDCTEPEEDLLIFPDDVEFKKVSQCTTGRVFVLKFKNSSRRFLFWMQEPKADKDDDYCQKVNEYLNNPPTPGANRGANSSSALPGELGQLGSGGLQAMLSGMNEQDLMQLLTGMGGPAGGNLSSLLGATHSSPGAGAAAGRAASATDSSATSRLQMTPSVQTERAREVIQPPAAPSKPPVKSGQSAVQLSDLQDILTNLNVPMAAGSAEPKEEINLSEVLKPDQLVPILQNDEVRTKLEPFLPPGETLPNPEDTIRDPHFQQALRAFSAALASGQLGPLMGQFGLGKEATDAATKGDVEGFVKALQDSKTEGDKDKESEHHEKMDES